MDHAARYEEDVFAWSQHQAKVLRGLAERAAGLPNDLDLEHVAEEIEDLGLAAAKITRKKCNSVISMHQKAAFQLILCS